MTDMRLDEIEELLVEFQATLEADTDAYKQTTDIMEKLDDLRYTLEDD